MLECSNIKKTYLNKVAVENISVSLEKGKIYAFLGPNGSGKTTFMKMVAGLVKPTEGTILFQEKPIGVESKKKIAYMPTEDYFYSYMTVQDVGKYYQDFFEDFDRSHFDKLLETMNLDYKQKVNKLSSGMLARVKFAATMARKAQLYMLDEPLNGIDLIAREHVINAILSVANQDNTVVLSSHLVDELEAIIDRVVFVNEGNVILQGDAETIREERGKSIVELYKELYA